MLNVFAPIDVKLDVIPTFITSIAVRIPTSAIIPMAIIIIVRKVLSDCDFTEPKAIIKFSLINGFMRQR
jgi:hypothetical protein